MLRAVIVDDEPPARRALAALMARHRELSLVGQAGSMSQAVDMIADTRPDVAFLDIELGGTSGFSLVARLAKPPHIVVVTAHSLHAPMAFDVAAVDFLLKPVLASRFATTVRRLRALQTHAPRDAQLKISTRRGMRLIEVSRIAALQAERDFTRLSIAGEPPLLLGRSFGSLVAELPSPPFMRLSRSVTVNLSRIVRADRIDRDQTLISLDGTETVLTLGRGATTTLKRHWPVARKEALLF